MSSEPKNIMTMAELLRAAKLKRQQEERDQNSTQGATITPATILSETIVNEAIPHSTIPIDTIPHSTLVNTDKQKKSKHQSTITLDTIVPNVIVDSSKGFFPYLNDLSDRVIPELKLKPLEQVVLNRLYRLSRGWKSEECTVGLGSLAKQCVMSRTSVQKSIRILVEKGLIEDLGEDKKGGKEGKRYRVLPGTGIPSRTIPRNTIVNDEDTVVPDITEMRGTIPPDTTNKDSFKNFKDIHTNTEKVVGAGASRFSLEECRRYAESLKADGIQNPGGYATTIWRTGEADERIDKFLNPPPPPKPVNSAKCPDCHGMNYTEPGGAGKGIKTCSHPKLKLERL